MVEFETDTRAIVDTVILARVWSHLKNYKTFIFLRELYANSLYFTLYL